jgi:uncharacterized protein YndB with AHSA1/START domain
MVLHIHFIEKGASMPGEEADPRVAVTVPVPPAEAFRIYTEQQLEWQPPQHLTVKDPESVTLEPRVGGRFYERGADGTEVVRGTIVEWAPPERVAVTWRIGPDWRPAPDDEHASVIVVEFKPSGPDSTEVVFTYTHLDRHGAMAPMLRGAIANPGPGNAVESYAEAVKRIAAAAG